MYVSMYVSIHGCSLNTGDNGDFLTVAYFFMLLNLTLQSHYSIFCLLAY